VAEDTAQTGNGKDESPPETLTRKAQAAEPATPRARRAAREPAVNAIEASPNPKKTRTPAADASAVAGNGSAPNEGSSASSPLKRADSDPWTVPEAVRDRFVQDGHRFYFPDGAPAFRDQGRRLTTGSENTQVIRSLIEIAHSRGWTEVTVTGTDRFREEAWRQARLEGLNVRGYRPNDEQQAQLIRALGRKRLPDSTERDVIAADGTIPATPAYQASQTADRPAGSDARERIAGKLLDHGRDTYRHDPNEEPSYFVRLQTHDGVREIWGKDIERAVAKSLTQPQVGEEVVLQRTGGDAVTVKRQGRDAEGNRSARDVDTYRNRWAIEKKEFFEQRAVTARIVRDEAIGPREAVQQHPELAGTYLNLRAAELASKRLRDPEDQQRFVAQVRGALADEIERGEPLQPVRLRERRAPQQTNIREALGRD
jgi:hypothetical protein